jgi:peptidoglycan/xylan/chitin deacetylase (PgdA/CDA1 family)
MGFSFRSDRLATLYLANPLRRILRDEREKVVPILMYHSVSELSERTCHPYYETGTTPRIFEEHVKSLYENGYSAIALNELPAVMSNGKGASRSVIITFDDGYRDFFDNAFPILERYGLKATVFLVAGKMGSRSSMLGGKEILTWGDARELRKRGVVFGSHTVNHLKLKDLPFIEVEAEIMDSKKEIESRLGVPVEAFSYPYAFPEGRADFLGKFFEILDRCGYRFGVTTVIGTVKNGDDLLELKRIPVNEYDDPALFKAKLEGAYDWVHVPQYLRKKCFGWIGA